MEADIICPFYAKNEDHCDVGCGYISSYDVNMIIRFCSGRFRECSKYQELAERFPATLLTCLKA